MKLTSFLTGSVLGAELVKGPFDVKGCGQVKSCYRNIDGCNIGDEDCILFSVQKANETAIFEVVGTGKNKYAAVGITNTPGMPKTDVYYCINGSEDAPVVQHAYAESRSPPVNKDNPMGFIVHDAGRSDSDIFYCRFQRPLSVTFDHGKDSLIFDLKKSVTMLMAKGPVVNNTPKFHGAKADKSKGNVRRYPEFKLSDDGPFYNDGKAVPMTSPESPSTPTTTMKTTMTSQHTKTSPKPTTTKPTANSANSNFAQIVLSVVMTAVGFLLW